MTTRTHQCSKRSRERKMEANLLASSQQVTWRSSSEQNRKRLQNGARRGSPVAVKQDKDGKLALFDGLP
jgi:hypothetical protein